jgi:hypothetical protein
VELSTFSVVLFGAKRGLAGLSSEFPSLNSRKRSKDLWLQGSKGLCFLSSTIISTDDGK